jgi:hypothetical protein
MLKHEQHLSNAEAPGCSEIVSEQKRATHPRPQSLLTDDKF